MTVKHIITYYKSLIIRGYYILQFSPWTLVRWNLISWILSCFIVTLHCQNSRMVFNFAETVRSRNSRNKSHAKFTPFTVFLTCLRNHNITQTQFKWITHDSGPTGESNLGTYQCVLSTNQDTSDNFGFCLLISYVHHIAYNIITS